MTQPSPLMIEQSDAVLLATEIRNAAEKAVRAGARGAALEANFEDEMKPVLKDAAKRMGVEIEINAQFTIIGAGRGGGIGKADLVFSNVIVELKAPGIFDHSVGCKFAAPKVTDALTETPRLPAALPAGNKEAVIELTRYIIGQAREGHGEKWAEHLGDYAGVGCDGFQIFFVRYLPPLQRFDVSETSPVSEKEFAPIHRLLLLMRAARKRALNANSLSADFAIVEQGRANVVNPLAQDIIKQFYTKVSEAVEQDAALPNKGAAVRARYSEWRKLFREALSFEEKEAREKFGEMQRLYGIEGRADQFNPAIFFFALSTYYGLLVKMLAAELLVNYCCSTVTTTLESLSGFESDTLRQHLHDMEREGGNFARFQIRNFLEGELFDWYVEPSVWDAALGRGVRAIIAKLAEYEIATFDLRPEETRDLLKDLYHRLFPQKLRHALGEYYTPDWLAEFTLEEVCDLSGYDGNPARRVLDPTCGSGTFLVEAIKLARKYARDNKVDPDMARALITRNIVGFDLNPLAVLTARANYIIALGDLIRGKHGLLALDEAITIPVYLTDSIMIPATPKQAGLQQNGGVYQVDLEALKELRPKAIPDDQLLIIPAPIVDNGKLALLTDLIREGLQRGWDSNRFRTEADTRLNLTDLYQQESGDLFSIPSSAIGQAQTLLAKIYDDMRQLEEAGLDGLWGRFLLNRFAPVLDVKANGQFDVIIGNPPWINWEGLPDDYRDSQQRVWKDYGLFKLAGSGAKGTSVRLGAGKKDISMLLTFVAVDKLLKDNGHLAFVITQSVFKTEAGDGFRKFVIPETVTYFPPLRVHDLSSFQPFEGATNRTAVFIVKKDPTAKQVSYPIDYFLWRKTSPIYPDDTLEAVKEKIDQYKLAAEPVIKNQNGGYNNDRWFTAKRKAIRALRKFTGAITPKYQAYAGSSTGGANGVYWLSIDQMLGKKHALVSNYTKGAKRKVKQYTGYKIETDLLFPLLRGRDVQRWNASPSLHLLMVQDPQKRMGYEENWLRDKSPFTYTWLTQFRKELSERKSSMIPKEPFYSMYAISNDTFAPYKVVWSEIAHTLKAAVIGSVDDQHLGEKVVVPDHTVILIPSKTEIEAHYVCALLNSKRTMFALC